jgi:alpha-beta hydrolase superfamily lysophospholipase
MACFGMDHIGHGLSINTDNTQSNDNINDSKGLISDYRILVEDFIHFCKHIRDQTRFSKLPSFIYCHSMGALVTILALNDIPNIVSVVFADVAIYPGYAASSPFGCKALSPIAHSPVAKAITYVSSSVDPKGAAGKMLLLISTLMTVFLLTIIH